MKWNDIIKFCEINFSLIYRSLSSYTTKLLQTNKEEKRTKNCKLINDHWS